MENEASTGKGPLAPKPCLNCRNRKIACDRSLPTCVTCTKRKKVCPGYSTNLSWPRVGDRRRAVVANVRSHATARPVAFLNTTTWDLGLYMESAGPDVDANLALCRVPRPKPSLHPPHFGTTIIPAEYASAMQMVPCQGDRRQDICSLLYRMSLNDDTPPSLAVRHSMSAISFLHLKNPPKAIHHHMLAVCALRKALNQISDSHARSQAIAASMLLSIYESVNIANSAKDWSIYFNGCLMIFESSNHVSYDGDGGTLLDWVLYYNAFCKLSITHWRHRTDKQRAIANRDIVISQGVLHPRRHIIQTTLGCSLELLGLLGQAVNLSRNKQDPDLPSPDKEDIDRLQRRLEYIDQQLCSDVEIDECHGIGSREHYAAIARLYQLSVIIYLDRVVRGSTASSSVSKNAAKESFAILRQIRACERPFPMFMLSLQTRDDTERALILEALKTAKKKVPSSKLDMTEGMVQRIWSQQDLCIDEDLDALFIMNAIFSDFKTPPCLA